MKTTLEIPDAVFREAKATAARQGRPLKEFVEEALREKLGGTGAVSEPSWRRAHGALRHLNADSRLVEKRIAAEFESIEPGDRE